jgi:imidazolonepropionase-like amidohydrolase
VPEAAPWQFKQVRRVPQRRAPDARLVLRGRVFTGEVGSTIERGFVRIDDGVITAVGAETELGSGGENAVELGGEGRTILPGLFNNHAHLAWDGANDLATQALEDEPEISAYKCAANMLRSLRAGVTTVRDLGMNRTNLYAKQAVAQGIFQGPKLRVCGEAIVQTGGHTYWCCREASGPDEMRRAVREQVRGGADLIKIMGCHDRLEFTDDELDAVVDETHRNGLPITAHATYDACIRRMLQHGVDTIEHGGPMSDDTIQLLLDRGTYVITTFAPVVMQAAEGEAWGIPMWKVEERRRVIADPSQYDGLIRAARAGVPIVFGTDAGSPVVPHDVIAPELEFMVTVGVCADNEHALQSITSLSARMNDMADDRGTLCPGLAADVIVVDGDPIADLRALERVEAVLLDGMRVGP